MEWLPYVFAAVLVILTFVLSIVGVQLILVLRQLYVTLRKVNTTLDLAEQKFNAIIVPLQHLSGTAAGLRTGFKVLESFASWLQKNNQK
jgi:hypothetical protein